MTINPSYEELEQRVRDLETETLESKRANEALRVSALAWQTLFDAVTDSVFLIDSEGKILLCNKATVNFLGKPINEIVGNTCWELVHATSEPIKGCPIVRMRETRRPESLELPVGDRVLYVATHPILDQDSNLASAVHIITDITERKRVEEALRESEERYQNLYNNAPDMYFTVSPNGIVKSVNQFGADYLGYSKEELIGGPVWTIVYKDDLGSVQKQVAEIFNQKLQKSELEFRKIRKDGSILWVHERTNLVLDENDNPIELWIICRDVTKRKKAEEALQRAHDELGKRVEERTAELSKVNEELKNKTINLKEANTALKVLLNKRQEDKEELEEKVLSNVKELIFPYIENLKMSRLDDRQMGLLGIIESNLNEIITPFLRKLSLKYSNLTPKEIQVAGLVKEGKTSKEIAKLLDSSKNAVEFHRRNLRKKLGIRNTKTNLSSYLLSLP